MQAPKSYTDAGALTILSGVMNIIVGGLLFLTMVWVCVGVLWLVPMAVGVFQVVVGISMNGGKRTSAASYISIVGIIAGVCNFNPLGIGAAVLAMLKVKEPEVAGYLTGS
ncbi:MAG: hypothetical protein V4850_15685 [Myxococcota bacterium]